MASNLNSAAEKTLADLFVAHSAIGADDCAVEEAIEEIMLRLPDWEVFRVGFEILGRDLPETLRYHSARHTHEVLHDALVFGLEDGLSNKELELLSIAALYHDLGFVSQQRNNESIAAGMAREIMHKCDYREEDIVAVETMILDTQLLPADGGKGLTQIPRSMLSNYLCDADLGNFGTEFFLVKSVLMYSEVTNQDFSHITQLTSERGLNYLRATLSLLEGHKWHTPAARKNRALRKEKNYTELRGIVELFSQFDSNES